MIATSFADGSVVTYECTKLGYTLTHNDPLVCQGTSWNGVKPECVGKYCSWCRCRGSQLTLLGINVILQNSRYLLEYC